MKLLYISSIFHQKSFGEVSQKILKMLFKYSDWDIHLFDIGHTREHANMKMNIFLNVKSIHFIPNYNLQTRNEFSDNYIQGVFHLRKYILKVNPDVIMALYNDTIMPKYAKIIDDMKKNSEWSGKYVPYIPIECANISPKSHNFNCDICLTVNEWSANQIRKASSNKYKVAVAPHIVDGFHPISFESRYMYLRKFYNFNFTEKYIIGFVNANQSRKRIDLVIKSFLLFNHDHPNSILVMKTTKKQVTNNLHHTSFDLDSINHPNIFIIDFYLNNEDLNGLYNTFDIMINATDGEGCGLTPLESAMAGVLSLFPNHSSYKCLEEVIPRAMIPTYQVPYNYSRCIHDYTHYAEGKELFSIYYDYQHTEDVSTPSKTYLKIIPNIPTYIISKIPSNINKYGYYQDIDLLLSNISEALEFQILITSDLETIRYTLNWLKNNGIIEYQGENRHRHFIEINSLENDYGEDSPTVGIVNPEVICDKLSYYYNHRAEYQEDLEKLQKYIQDNFSEETAWKAFEFLSDYEKN